MLSMRTGAGLDFFYGIPFLEALGIAGELMEVMEEAERYGGKNGKGK